MGNLIGLTGMTLCLTDDCNLRCKYCFVNQSPNYMSLKTAKDAIDFLVRNSQESYEVNVRLFGGEPLLAWNQVIVPLVEYSILEKNYRTHFSVVTNGILLTQDKIDFMKKYNIKLYFSMDGDKETQDINRPFQDKSVSSFDILEKKIPMIVNNFNDIIPRGTITSDTVHRLYDDIMFMKNSGFRKFGSFVNELEEWSDESITLLKNGINKYMIYFIKENSNRKLSDDFIKWDPFYYGLKEYIQIKDNTDCPTQPYGIRACGLGSSHINVNYNGDIFTCNNLVSYDEKDNLYYIGNIYDGIDKKRHNNLLSHFIGQKLYSEDIELCKNCIRKSVCDKGFCHAKSYIKYNKMNVKTRIRCLFDIFLVESAGFAYEVLTSTEEDNCFKHDFL